MCYIPEEDRTRPVDELSLDEIDRHGDEAAQRYIDNMLKAGSSAPPLDILLSAGVDLESPAPIIAAMKMFERTVDEFDRVWTGKQRGL